jgi:hypothetical protein
MHPLNKLAFGNAAGKIKVNYNNGSSVVTGYIVKQVSATKWIVSTDGITTYKCELEATATPAAGQFTIFAFPLTAGSPGSAVYVGRIDGHHVSTSDGHQYIWTINTVLPTGAGYAKLDTI